VKKLEEEVKAHLAEAARVDAEEDGEYGKGKRGDELPEELARREGRLGKIREANAALEEEAREAAKKKQAEVEARLREREKQEEARGRKLGGRPPQAPNPEGAKPEPKAQRNFTDRDSRIMKDGATKEFVQGYNAQAAVDSQAQVIVAASVTQEANDKRQLVPMLEQVEVMTGSKPEHGTAEAGYFSEQGVTDPNLEGIDLLVAPDRQQHGEEGPAATGPPPPEAGVAERMRQKLRTVRWMGSGRRANEVQKRAVVRCIHNSLREPFAFSSWASRTKKSSFPASESASISLSQLSHSFSDNHRKSSATSSPGSLSISALSSSILDIAIPFHPWAVMPPP
jgi:hypothetical protein